MITEELAVTNNIDIGEKRLITAKNDRIFKAIFVNEKDHHLMETLLSECLEEKVKIIKYLKVELGVTNVSEKTKRLDVVLESKNKKMIVELNTEGPSVNNRNFRYFSKFYGTETKIGEDYKEEYEYILINLSYNVKDNKLKREYKIQDKEGKSFVKNFRVIEFIMDKITKECYDRIMEGTDIEYKHLAMLNLDKETLTKLSEYDNIVKEYMEKLVDLNEDEVFIGPLRIEEDEKVIQEMAMKYRLEEATKEAIEKGLKEGIEKGIKEGIKEGEKQKAIEMAKNLIEERINIDIIAKASGLSKDEILKL